MVFNVEQFLQTLPVMAKGMAGIFIVTAVIVLAITLLGKIPSKDEDEK